MVAVYSIIMPSIGCGWMVCDGFLDEDANCVGGPFPWSQQEDRIADDVLRRGSLKWHATVLAAHHDDRHQDVHYL